MEYEPECKIKIIAFVEKIKFDAKKLISEFIQIIL